MTTFKWTPAQLARLVPGATVALHYHDTGGRERVTLLAYDDDALELRDNDGVPLRLWQCDPASLRPPSLTWLRKMARRKLGKGAIVQELADSTVSVELSVKGAYPRQVAWFSGCDTLDARSSCAVWLHALTEVAGE